MGANALPVRAEALNDFITADRKASEIYNAKQ